ncbi:hypothetical protein F5Y02DRAFT_69891 [Annulohypoxylon stygium]|nr:hypothetical protein F5Y02DRAFT_69891 [Annulohypoxylon stygium]
MLPECLPYASLRATLSDALRQALVERRRAAVRFSGRLLGALRAALAHFVEPSAVNTLAHMYPAARMGNPIPPGLLHHLLAFLQCAHVSIRRDHASCRARLVLSAWLLDAYPPDMHGYACLDCLYSEFTNLFSLGLLPIFLGPFVLQSIVIVRSVRSEES